MPQSLSERKAELDSQIRGFLSPVFERHSLITGQLTHAMFKADDVRKLVQGYACPDCLAEYVTYLQRCPVCGYERDVELDVRQAPDDWLQHLENRIASPVTPGIPEGGYDAAQIMEKRIAQDADMERIPSGKLKRRPRG